MPRAKKKPLPTILTTPIERPAYMQTPFLWECLYKQDKYKLFDKEFAEREQALFEYFDLKPVKIQQVEVRELICRLALSHIPQIRGFAYKHYPNVEERMGDKGYILYARVKAMQIQMKLEKESNKNPNKKIKTDLLTAVSNVGQKYNYPQKELYSIFQKINHSHPNLSKLKQQFDKHPLETVNELENLGII